jgi:transmembrane sensor
MERLGQDLPRAMPATASVDELVDLVRHDETAAGNVVGFLREPRPARTSRWRRPLMAQAAAVAVLAIAALFLWRPVGQLFAPQPREWSFATASGQQLTVPLADGSTLKLDAVSAAVVRFDDDGRQVRLLRGRAMFVVEHDAARPFEVIAGAARIVDVGTEFDVDLQSDGTVVTVTAGVVEVGVAGAPEGSAMVRLGAGERVRVGNAVVAAPVRIDPAQAAPWLRGLLVFADAPLAQAVEEWGRYSTRRFEFGSPGMATRHHVNGSFRASDLNGFLQFLRGQGLRVEAMSDDRIVVSED